MCAHRNTESIILGHTNNGSTNGRTGSALVSIEYSKHFCETDPYTSDLTDNSFPMPRNSVTRMKPQIIVSAQAGAKQRKQYLHSDIIILAKNQWTLRYIH